MQLRDFFISFCTGFALSLLTLWPDVVLAEEYADGDLQDGAEYAAPFKVESDAQLAAGSTATVNGPTASAISDIVIGSRQNKANLAVSGTLIVPFRSDHNDREISGNGSLDVRSGGKIQFTGAIPFNSINIKRAFPTNHFALNVDSGAELDGGGAGINIFNDAELTANGNLLVTDATIQAGGKYRENKEVTIDGLGGTGTTRAFITTYNGYYINQAKDILPGGIYEGDVIVNHELAGDWRDDGGLVIGGTHTGNVTLLKGIVDFWRGGELHGNLVSSGGVVRVGESLGEGSDEPERHETTIYGDIRIKDGSFVIDPNIDFTFQNGLDIQGGELSAKEANLSSNGDIAVTNGANADIGTLADFSKKLIIGSEKDTEGGASLAATSLDLGANGMLLMDPPWGLEPSNAAIENLGPVGGAQNILEGQIGVGMNSMLAVGTRDLT